MKLLPPETEERATFLAGPRQTAQKIAVGSSSCVMAALADLELWLDSQIILGPCLMWILSTESFRRDRR